MSVIGIDLGTTNSAAAAVESGKARVLPNRNNDQLTPSVVSYFQSSRSDEGEIVVGREAYNNAARDPQNTVLSIKRLMGRVYGESWKIHGREIDLKEIRKRVSFRIADPPDKGQEDQGIKVLLNDMPYSPTEISALILKEIMAGADLAMGEPPTHAVITVPAYFNERQRHATQQAGEQAGLNVLKVIDEPTAAALAFGAGKEEERHRVLVYDLGGGTFDISIIQMTKGQYHVLGTEGDNFLGGDDFDRFVVQRMIQCFKEEHDYDPSNDKSFLVRAKDEAESIKRALSTRNHVERLFGPVKSDVGMLDISFSLSREEFENDIGPLVNRTIKLTKDALGALTPDQITQVLLVGGSTAVPLVQQSVIDLFGQEKVKRNVNPMECVALGAAIMASSLKVDVQEAGGESEGPRLVENTPMHLGIAALDGDNPDAFAIIIPKNTPYPLQQPMTKKFRPTRENQTLIRVPVYEGLNTARASLNEQQGVIQLPLEKGISASTAVEVSFNYDKNRLLTVAVRVADTDEYVEKQLLHDRARVEQESLMDDWREELQPAIRAGQHFQETYGSFMEDEDKAELEDAIQNGEKALDDGDQTAGEQAAKVISNKLLYTSGVATQLFIAERAMALPGVSAQSMKHLADAITQLRAACEENDEQEVKRLNQGLRLLLPQIMKEAGATRPVDDQEDLKDILRTF